MINVKVIYIGILADISGKSIEYLNIPEDTSIESLIAIICEKNGLLRDWLSKAPLVHISVNGVDATTRREIILRDGDEVVLSTPLYEGG